MSREFVCAVADNIFATQYFVTNLAKNVVIFDENMIHHHIYGPAINSREYKHWLINDDSCRLYYPYSIYVDSSTETTEYAIHDETTDLKFLFYVKAGIVCKIMAHSTSDMFQFELNYEGDSTYTCGVLTIQTMSPYKKLIALDDSPETQLLRRIHAANEHLFFTSKLNPTPHHK